MMIDQDSISICTLLKNLNYTPKKKISKLHRNHSFIHPVTTIICCSRKERIFVMQGPKLYHTSNGRPSVLSLCPKYWAWDFTHLDYK